MILTYDLVTSHIFLSGVVIETKELVGVDIMERLYIYTCTIYA